MDTKDFSILDDIIKAKYRGRAYWTYADNFDEYFNNVISDSLDQFVRYYFNFKVEDDEDWFTKRHAVRMIFNSLAPYLKKRYNHEAKAYYKRMVP
jgi:ubiquinone biosynthesis protein COQ9